MVPLHTNNNPLLFSAQIALITVRLASHGASKSLHLMKDITRYQPLDLHGLVHYLCEKCHLVIVSFENWESSSVRLIVNLFKIICTNSYQLMRSLFSSCLRGLFLLSCFYSLPQKENASTGLLLRQKIFCPLHYRSAPPMTHLVVEDQGQDSSQQLQDQTHSQGVHELWTWTQWRRKACDAFHIRLFLF